MTDKVDFTEEMDHLAAEIAKELRLAATALGDKVDGFKALMPYYTLKAKNKPETPDDDLPNFENFNAKIHAVK